MHGNLSQNQRDRNLAAFNSGDVNVMVATDVAARGIDVSGVELVVQVEPPEDPKSSCIVPDEPRERPFR